MKVLNNGQNLAVFVKRDESFFVNIIWTFNDKIEKELFIPTRLTNPLKIFELERKNLLLVGQNKVEFVT